MKAAKHLNSLVPLADLGAADFSGADVCAGMTDDDITTTRILLISLKCREDRALAGSLLIRCAEDASPFNLDLIFKKLDLTSSGALSLCRRYICIPRYRHTIASLFRKSGVFCEEAHVYDIRRLQRFVGRKHRHVPDGTEEADAEPRSSSALHRLCGTINTPEFKITKKTLLSLPFYNSLEYFPVLTEQGIRNYRELTGGSIFEHGLVAGSAFHVSETVRVEHFGTLTTHSEILEYFRYNQFIEDLGNQKRLVGYFADRIRLSGAAQDKAAFKGFIDTIVETVVVKMCDSTSLPRRHLGACLLLAVLGLVGSTDAHMPLIDRLVYDKAHEIRTLVSVLCPKMGSCYAFPVHNLFSHHYYMIFGATSYLRGGSPERLLGILRAVLSTKVSGGGLADFLEDKIKEEGDREVLEQMQALSIETDTDRLVRLPIFGLVHCLAVMGCASGVLRTLVDSLYGSTLGKEDTLSWRTLKECCFYYHRLGNVDILMRTLLCCDHFGITSSIKSYLVLDAQSTERYLPWGIECIENKKNNTRKSGGLSVFFLALVQNRANYECVKRRIVGLLYDEGIQAEGSCGRELNGDEAVVFHCLNILRSFVEDCLGDDVFFYFDLSLQSLLHSSFNIKNCGCAIFGALAKKILTRHRTFDALFLVDQRLRDRVHGCLLRAISSLDLRVVYFILFVYRRTDQLTQREVAAAKAYLALGGFVRLQAAKVISRTEDSRAEASRSFCLRFREGLSERKTLFLVHQILGSGDPFRVEAAKRFLQEKHHIPFYSTEYTKHKVVELAVSRGHRDYFYSKITDRPARRSTARASKYFEEDTDLGQGDVEYDVGLLSLYSNR